MQKDKRQQKALHSKYKYIERSVKDTLGPNIICAKACTGMRENMTDLEAIEKRYSRRSYLNTRIDNSNLKVLKATIENYNKVSGLSIQLIEEGRETFHGLTKSYGMFSGVQSFFALVGSTEDLNLKEKVGYYGELLVLEATKLGLGTCWVGGSFDRKHCPCTIKEKEALICVIALGNVEEKQSFKEKTIHKMTHRRPKPLEFFYTSDVPAPDWFLAGMKAVYIAPSTANSQPVHFTLKNDIVIAQVKSTNYFQLVDLGIAKAHFELATGRHFELGNHGRLL